jgi:hypothetical protein
MKLIQLGGTLFCQMYRLFWLSGDLLYNVVVVMLGAGKLR